MVAALDGNMTLTYPDTYGEESMKDPISNRGAHLKQAMRQ